MERLEDIPQTEGLRTKEQFGEIFASVSDAIESGKLSDNFSLARTELKKARKMAEALTSPDDQELKGQALALIESYEEVINP